MKRRTKAIMATAVLLGFGLLIVTTYAGWRISENHRLATAVPVEEETESAKEIAAAYEAEPETALLLEITTTAETMLPTEKSGAYTETETEVGTEKSLPEPTETETEPETMQSETEAEPTTPATIDENAPILPETTTEAQFTTEQPTEPLRPVFAFTAEEEQLLMRVASLEAGNQGWVGMALVMCVIINRTQAYGQSVAEVVYAPRQFSVIGCEKWNAGYIAPEAPLALQAVKDGWDGAQGALFFCAPRANSWHKANLTYLFTGFGHEFYK